MIGESSNNMPIKMGDIVKIEYILKDKEGNFIGSSEDKNDGSVKIHLGMGQVFRGFEEAISGMEKGEEREFTLEPREAYGEFNPLLLKKIPKKDLSDELELKLRNKVEIVGPSGITSIGWIRLIEDDFIIIDLNPPLAGKTLHFSVKVVDTDLEPDETPNLFQFGLSCGVSCNHDHDD